MLLCLKRTVRASLCSHGPGAERLPCPSDMPAPEDSGAGEGGGSTKTRGCLIWKTNPKKQIVKAIDKVSETSQSRSF